MSALALQWGLVLAAVLFGLGLAGLLARRNLVFVLLSIEVMVNAGGLAFVTAGARHGEPDGQVMFLFVLAMAAAEVAIGLALVLELRRRRGTIDADALDRLAEPAGR